MIIIKFYYKVYDNWESYICVLYIFVYDGYVFLYFVGVIMNCNVINNFCNL